MGIIGRLDMIFVNEEFEAERDIVICGYYVPYSRWKNDPHMAGVPYDLYSRKILDLKDGKRSAVNYFYALLDEEICPGVAILRSALPLSPNGGERCDAAGKETGCP